MEGLPFYLDIIELIIDVFAQRRDMDMLAAFSLVSRFTRAISHPHIFKVVDLQSCTDPFKQQQRSELLDNLLKKWPELGKHIKEIRLGDCRIPLDTKRANNRYHSTTYEGKRAENRLLLVSQMESCYASILSRLPNIRGFRFIAKDRNRLDWTGDFPESLQDAIVNIMRKPDLTAFSIAGISGFPQSLLCDLTQIQVLEVWDATFDFPAPEVEFPTSDLYLKHLVVAPGDPPDNGFDNLIYNFMERSAETLEHLTWIMDEEHEDPVTVDFKFLKRLRSLCLQVTALGPEGAVPRLLRQLSLAQSNSLEYITFNVKHTGVFMFSSLEDDVKDRWRVVDSILCDPSFHRLRRIKILSTDWRFFGQHSEVFHGLCERGIEICVDETQ